MVMMQEDLDLPGGEAPEDVIVDVFVAGNRGVPVDAAYVEPNLDPTLIGLARLTVDNGGINTDGEWELDMAPSSLLVPDGAVYGVTVTGRRVRKSTRFFEVPASGGPHTVSDNLVDPPGALLPAGGGAPLDNPVFTGEPTAPTPPAGNNSTRLATTAFVIGESVKYATSAQGDTADSAVQPGDLADVATSGDKADVGLGNVDNTSDLDAPVSTATQNALTTKADDNAVVKLTGAQTVAGAKTFSTAPKIPDAAAADEPATKSQLDALSGIYAPISAGIEGTGMPNGVVTAPVGTVYRDLVATNGAVMWVKESGTGNTGWASIGGNTGWREFISWGTDGVVTGPTFTASYEPSSGEAGLGRIERVGSVVSLYLSPLKRSSGSDKNVFDTFALPVGFRPSWTAFTAAWSFGDNRMIGFQCNSLGVLGRQNGTYAGSGSPASQIRLTMLWPTRDPWPATLPGTPT